MKNKKRKNGCVSTIFSLASMLFCLFLITNQASLLKIFNYEKYLNSQPSIEETEDYTQPKNNSTKTIEPTPLETTIITPPLPIPTIELPKPTPSILTELLKTSPNEKFKNNKEVIEYARKACASYLTDPKNCRTLPISVDRNSKLEGLIAGETISSTINNEYIKVNAVFFNQNILQYSKRQAAWVIFHELSHVEALQLNSTPASYLSFQKRAQKELTWINPETKIKWTPKDRKSVV